MSRELGDRIAEAILANHTAIFAERSVLEDECWDMWVYDRWGEEALKCTHLEDAEIARSFT